MPSPLFPLVRAFRILLNRHRLRKIAGEVHVKAFHNGEPVSNELQGNDIENTLQNIDRFGDLDLQCLAGLELLVTWVADDDGFATTSDHCGASSCQQGCSRTERTSGKSHTLLIGVQALLEQVIPSEDHDDRQILVHQRQHAVFEFSAHNSLTVQITNFLDL